MYKITLYDNNCSPICDGTTSFFVDELEEFENPWISNELVDEEQKKRFLQSKAGQIVTDYYTDDPKYNIVQQDENAEVILEKIFMLKDNIFTLYNFYNYESKIFAKEAIINLRYIKFNNEYFLIGRYSLIGVCTEDKIKRQKDRWRQCSVYGNPIHKLEYHSNTSLWIDEAGYRRLDYPKEKFIEDKIETYCWITIREDQENELEELNLDSIADELIVNLMRDIPGEAG